MERKTKKQLKKAVKKIYVNIVAYSILIYITFSLFVGTCYLLQVLSEIVK